MSIQLFGRWQLKVTKTIHNWENRFRIDGASSGSGVYPPTVSLEVTADGAAWTLTAEYREPGAGPWKPSDMMIDTGLERVAIRATIGAEDPLPLRDFEDIQWDAAYLDGTMLQIPYRPYAVRPNDLVQMPDGIFETALGSYYMAVRVINRWGLPFTHDHVLDITPAGRAELAMRGIHVSDAWSQAELAALGQSQNGTGMVLGPLPPGAARTVYFKVDVSGAPPRKHEVEFICRNMAGMADPNHPARRVRKQIFVSPARSSTPLQARSWRRCKKARCGSSCASLRLTARRRRQGGVAAASRRRNGPTSLRASGCGGRCKICWTARRLTPV